VPYASTAGNIVTPTQVAAAGNLTLTQDTFATTLVTGSNGQKYVQFDWPRVPYVVVGGAGMVAASAVTIFGTDWYGQPLQHTYQNIQAAGTYPLTYATATKAFYTVTRIYVNGSCNVGGTLAIRTSNTFGLPYVVKEASYASNFSWDGNNFTNQYGVATMAGGTITVNTPAVIANSRILLTPQVVTAPGVLGVAYITNRTPNVSFTIESTNEDDTSTMGWFIPNGGQNLIKVADANVATALTGDVRGLIKLPETGETWANVPNGIRRFVYTPYVFGADQFQNQLAEGDQLQGFDEGGEAPETVPPLTSADLYGVTQYYTGTV
jgi:hypothetical protein